MPAHLDVGRHLLYADACVMVLNKPAGLMVEPDRNGYPNLLQEVRRYVKDTALPGEEVYAQHLHRLDRPVSGLVLFARKREVLHILSNQFAERRVEKYYQALTTSAPPQRQGVLAHWHRKEKKRAVIGDQEWPFAEAVRLDYAVTPHHGDTFLWNIQLHTGKYHQIRAQLAHIGCPIVGDASYGSALTYRPDAIALHASRLRFSHPETGESIVAEQKAPFLTD